MCSQVSLHGYCFPHNYQHLETEPPLLSVPFDWKQTRKKNRWDQPHWCLLTTMGSVIPHFGSSLSETLYVVPAQDAEQQACLCERDLVIRDLKLRNCRSAPSYIIFETPESFNILCNFISLLPTTYQSPLMFWKRIFFIIFLKGNDN